jgi:hypothetical protein
MAVVERESNSLRNRFQRAIAKQTKEWNPFYKKIVEAPPSGTMKDNWISLTPEEYNNQYGRRFLFEHCVEILHQLPKFDPMIGGTVDGEEGLNGDGEPVDVNNTSVAMRPTWRDLWERRRLNVWKRTTIL